MATVKRILKTIFIIGGNAGAKIATNIFSLTHSNHSLCYVECFSRIGYAIGVPLYVT
jgi:hypothetical protein